MGKPPEEDSSMYAVLDIEATGGQMGEEDIIEIAVYRFNGRDITDQLISMVKPDRAIDPFVQRLTGITGKMVRTAPKFHEIAKRIIEITEGATLVGHNVDFDYRMLRQEFKKFGYVYQRETIDTVQLSEKYFPESNSHSLGKLCKELGIPTSNRHRASGDALATLELFKLIIEKDSLKDIAKKGIDLGNSNKNEKSGFKGLPNTAGVFYIFNSEKEVVYLSSANNIAQSARRIINSKSELSQRLRPFSDNIKFEITSTELIARLKELNELRKLKPKYYSKKSVFSHFIVLQKTRNYKTLIIQKAEKATGRPVLDFQNPKDARETLTLLTKEYNLCPKLNRLTAAGLKCFSYEIGECKGACEGKESPEDYNARMDLLLEKINLKNKNFLLIDKGRAINEKSFIWVKDTYCIGFGYFEFHTQIKDEKTIRERMTVLAKHQDFTRLLKPYLIKEKYRELIFLDSQ